MRVWLARVALLSALGAAGFWAWQFLFPTPEHVIRKRLGELAAAASISSSEGQLAKLANTQKLVSFFTSDVQVTVDVPGRSMQTFNGRVEIQQATLGARGFLGSLKVQFVDVIVSVGPDKQSAQAHLTATVSLPGEKLPEVQELEMGFKKVDHDWLINHVETVKTLR